MITLYSYDNGPTFYLSDEIYVVLTDNQGHSPDVKAGTLVRLVSGVNHSDIPGYHPDADWVTCTLFTRVIRGMQVSHMGFHKSKLARLPEWQEDIINEV